MPAGDAPRRRPGRLLTVVVACVVFVAACTGSDDQDVADRETSTTIPRPQTLLRVGAEAWPDCLNPITCDSEALREQVLQHVLPSALELGGDGEYQPSPLLSAAPELDALGPGMTVTYRISPDARWSDGAPITSSDFRGTWRAVLDTPGADVLGYDRITEVDDTDPLVAIARFSSPYPDWKQLFGAGRGWVLQADAFGGNTDLSGRFAAELPFSAGPYRLAAWDDDAAVLAADEDHWAEARRPAIDQVRLVRLDAVDELVQPEAFDLLIPADPAPGPAPDGFASRILPTTRVLGVWFDRRTPLLRPLVNRQILAALVDRAALAEEVTGDEREPIGCVGWVPDVGPWCEVAAVDPSIADPDVASFVLQTEGWSRDAGSGTRVRDGEAFVVSVTHDPQVPGATAVADALATAFQGVGIGVISSEFATSDWQASRGADVTSGVGVFAVDLGVSPRVDDLYACLAGAESSALFWCPPGVVEAARELGATADPSVLERLVADIGRAAGIDVAWLPIVQQTATSFARNGRVIVPTSTSILGGALGSLYDFEVA